jgi:hypothetical protein
MTNKTQYNPETHHPKTGARRSTTTEIATPRTPPSVAQVLAQQARDPEHIDKQGRVVKETPPLPVPAQLTEAQRAENLARNMAAIGSQFLTRFDFEGTKGIFEEDGDDFKPGLCICPVRDALVGFRRFNGEGNPVDVTIRRLDEGDLYTRDDLDGGHETEVGKFGPRPRWQEYAILPLIDIGDGGGELYGFEANNITSYWAIRNLIGRCHNHPMFKRGLSPIVQPEIVTYKHKDYGVRFKPAFKIVGWANSDGSPVERPPVTSPRITSGKLSDVLNDAIPDFAK